MRITKVSVADGNAFVEVDGVGVPIVLAERHSLILVERSDGQVLVETLSLEGPGGGHIIAEERTPLK